MYRHKKRNFILLFALCTLCVVVLAGCGNRTQEPAPNQNPTDNSLTPNTNNQDMQNRSIDHPSKENTLPIPDNSSATQENAMNTEDTRELAQAIVKEIPEVKDAHVFLMENMAYVALDIERTADSTEAAQLKEQVSNLLKEKDSKITNVYVSEDADTFTRFGEIAKDIADGKPLSGFMEEIKNFFTRVTPTN